MFRVLVLTTGALCLLFTPALAQTAKAHFAAGEQAIKDVRWVEAGLQFEMAAKMAPNNRRYQERFAEVRVEASGWAESAAKLLLSAEKIREAESFVEIAARFDPNSAAVTELLEQVKVAKLRRGKFNAVQSIYVDEIKGENGEMTREQIKALLANTGRFQVLGEEKDRSRADATIGGRAELREIETLTTISAKSKAAGMGSVFGSGGGRAAGAVGGGFGTTSDHSTTSVKPITAESVVLSLTLKSGEVIWGWDGNMPCEMTAKQRRRSKSSRQRCSCARNCSGQTTWP